MNLALKKAILKWALVTLALLLVAGCSRNSSSTGGSQNQKNTNTTTSGQQHTTSNNSTPSSSASTSSDASKSIVYKNTQYGFSFKLPSSWSGYTIVTSQWEGVASNGSKLVETGPIISIRDPKWTKETPRQDIPIMVFTLNQWESLKQEAFHIGAAPVNPTELGRNNIYVFALPARYNFANLPGTEDVQNILAGNPLQVTTAASPDASMSIVYNNTQYGFSFKLPSSWSGYTIVTSQWEGISSNSGTAVETGPIISIRDPKWTKETPRQDIPIMVFTLNQWNSLRQGAFHIGAAPVDPTELGRNNNYVFALPARYNFANLPGTEDVQNILAGNPLQITQ